MRAFVEEYSAARAAPLHRAERRQARCLHRALRALRIDGYDAAADPDSFTVALRAHGRAYLQL